MTHRGEQGAKDAAGDWKGRNMWLRMVMSSTSASMFDPACDKRAADRVPRLLGLNDCVNLEVAGGLYRTPFVVHLGE